MSVPRPADDFSFDLPAPATPEASWTDTERVGVVRLWSGDQPRAKALVSDTEILYVLAHEAPDVRYAALAVLDMMESRIVAMDASSPAGQAQRNQRTMAIASARARLRTRLAGGTYPRVTVSAEDIAPRAFSRGSWNA